MHDAMLSAHAASTPDGRSFSLAALVAAAPDIMLGVMYLLTWFAPTLLGEGMYYNLFLIMGMEFLALHSGAFFMYIFLGGCHWIISVPALLGISAFYLFAGQSVAESIGASWPLWGVVGLTINRMKTLLLTKRTDTQRRQQMLGEWGLSFALFIGVIVLALFPWPHFGLPDPLILHEIPPGSGDQVFDPPQFVTAFGFFYFTAQGLLDLFRERIMGWLKRRWSTSLLGRMIGSLAG